MKQRLLLFALIPLLLTGCVQSDTDLVLDFVNTWLEQRGVIDENGKPTMKAMGVATGWATTGDDRVDAAVQAGKVLKDIKEADKQVDKAKEEWNKKPPNTDEAKKYMDAAVNMRPEDWYYRNSRGTLLLQTGNTSEAAKDFSRADKSCSGNSRCLQAMYEHRVESINNSQGTERTCAMQSTLAESYDKLATVASNANDKAHYATEAGNTRANLGRYCD